MDRTKIKLIYGSGWRIEVADTTLAYFEGDVNTFEVPDGITTIALGAFEGGTVNEVVLPPSVTKIEGYAFGEKTGLKKINVRDYVDVDDKAFAGCKKMADNDKFVIFRNVLQSYHGHATQVHIPEGVTKISENVFAHHEELQYVEFPSTLESIGHAAFYECTELRKIVIPPSVKYIGDAAFKLCKRLAEVSLPETLTDTGGDLFSDCGYMTKNGMQIIDGRLFGAYYEARELVIPDHVRTIENGACMLPNLRTVVIPEGVTRIGNLAFRNCRYLREITLPSTLEKAGNDVFCDYRAVKKPLIVYVKEGTYAHSYALSLGNVEIKIT